MKTQRKRLESSTKLRRSSLQLIFSLDDVTDREAIAIHQSPIDLGSVKPQIAMGYKLQELGFHNVLTGDGADELFAGYRRYVPFANNWPKYVKYISILNAFAPMPNKKMSNYNFFERRLSSLLKSFPFIHSRAKKIYQK